MKDQIFISYRREGGEVMAQLLYDKLVERGYRVFYDIESLKSGPFDNKLYEKIEECDDFILVLPPHGLDRCIYDEDWVRCEIRHALQLGKNIIPIMMRGFSFPEELPDDIRAVTKMNGVEFKTMEYLDARIDRVASMFLSRPSNPAARPTPFASTAPSPTAAYAPAYNGTPTASAIPTATPAMGAMSKEEKQRSRPKGLLLHFLTLLSLAFFIGFAGESIIISLAAVVFMFVFGIKLVRYTKKYVVNSWIVSILFVFPGFFYYGIYLLIAAILSAFVLPKR